MSDGTDIGWTLNPDHTRGVTWNPLLGCLKISAGCHSCYAIVTAQIRAGNPHPAVAAAFAGLTEHTDHGLDWTGQVNLLPQRLTQPLRYRKPRGIFVTSLSDLFYEQVPDEYIARVLAVMAVTPQHIYYSLSKRVGRMRSLLSSAAFQGRVMAAVEELAQDHVITEPVSSWPLPNLWLGTSAEDHHQAEIRVPKLLDTPAAVHWLSAEPLIGETRLRRLRTRRGYTDALAGSARLDWVVTGGESAAKARAMHPDWPRRIRDDCEAAGTPFFFKQWGSLAPESNGHDRGPILLLDRAGRSWNGLESLAPEGSVRMRRVPKKVSGHILDGREHLEFPAAFRAFEVAA